MQALILQVQPRKHALNHSNCMALTLKHELYRKHNVSVEKKYGFC